MAARTARRTAPSPRAAARGLATPLAVAADPGPIVSSAHLAAGVLPPFGHVEAAPGSEAFGAALTEYATSGPLLLAAGVCRTGGTMERLRAGQMALGVCLFCRHPSGPDGLPDWITPLLSVPAGPRLPAWARRPGPRPDGGVRKEVTT